MMTREQALEVAKSWKGTPYIIRGQVKGGGCDCATLLGEYLIEIGAVPREELPAYSGDWFLHATDNRYLVNMMKYATLSVETICRGTLDAKPGDILLVKHLRKLDRYTHGAIVLDPAKGLVLHSVTPKVTVANCMSHPLMGFKEVAIFNPWKEEADVRIS